MNEFRDLNQLPVELNFDREMDVDQLVKQEAKWHKSCHMKFNSSKLDEQGQGKGSQKKLLATVARDGICITRL